MNLMFWKKKPRAEESTDNQEKPADGDKTGAGEAPDLDAPAKPGLLARIKSGFSNLGRRFRKAPAANADGTASPQEEEDDKTVAMEAPDLDAQPKTGLLARIKGGFSGLARRFRKSSAPGDEDAAETQTGESPAVRPMRTKRRLIIGGAIGLLILLLSGAGFATWKIFFSAPEHEASAPTTAAASHDQPQETQAETALTEIETLRKKNEELQAQIEALKHEPSQADQPKATTDSAESAAAATPGEMTLSNRDPKAAAQSLKEAIEAMNAGSAGPARKPEKQKPPAEAGGD